MVNEWTIVPSEEAASWEPAPTYFERPESYIARVREQLASGYYVLMRKGQSEFIGTPAECDAHMARHCGYFEYHHDVPQEDVLSNCDKDENVTIGEAA